MRVIVAGGRDFTDYERLEFLLETFIRHRETLEGITIVSGHAEGADKLGEQFAKDNGYEIEIHPARWDKYGRGAGHVRNREMALCADVLIAFWDGESKGTRGMILEALHEGLEIHLYRYKNEEE